MTSPSGPGRTSAALGRVWESLAERAGVQAASGKADPDLTATDPIGDSPDQRATTTSAATEGARTMFSGVSR